MRYNEDNIRDILKKELTVSRETEEKLRETYEMLQSQNESRSKRAKKSWRKLTTAAAAIAAALTVTAGTAAAAYISSHTDFLQTMFGNNTRDSVKPGKVSVETNDGSILVDIPGREYVPVDEEKADRLIGDKISEEKISVSLGEHTLTIENYVTDGNAVFINYTLERDGGVTAMKANEETNRGKGAEFTDASDFYFLITDQNENPAAEHTYIDLEKSSEEKYYLYSYAVWTSDAEEETEPQLEILRYPVTRGEIPDLEEKNMNVDGQVKKEVIKLSAEKPVEMRTVEEDGEWICSYSPISISVNMIPEADSAEEAMDPWCIRYIALEFKDGSKYVLHEKDKTDNAGYTCGVGTQYRAAFNRIIDPDEVSKIMINDKIYR